jgi:hypothetical protein
LWVLPKIEKLTEYKVNGHAYTLPKNIRWYIFFFGVVCFLFINIIRTIRKDLHYENELVLLKHRNFNNKNSDRIKQIERSLKLSKLKRKSKKIYRILNLS